MSGLALRKRLHTVLNASAGRARAGSVRRALRRRESGQPARGSPARLAREASRRPPAADRCTHTSHREIPAMQTLTPEQLLEIAHRVHETLDEPKRWHQGSWGRDDDGYSLSFDGRFHIEDEEGWRSRGAGVPPRGYP